MFILTPIIAATLVGADVQIEQIVPDTTIAVISTDDVGTLIKHLKSSGICDSMGKLCSTLSEEYASQSCMVGETQCSEMFFALGIDKETWEPPTGHAGFAVYPVVDYEIDSVGLGLFGIIELDESTYGEIFSTKLETFITELDIEIDSISISGRDVWMIQNPITENMQTPSFIDSSAFDYTYIVFSRGYLLIGTETDIISSALLAIDGDISDERLVSNEDYLALVDRCGDEGDLFAGVLLTNLADTIVQMDQTGMSMMILPTFKTIFGDVDGIAESVSVSPSSDVLVDAKYTALMNDGRSGLLGLYSKNATQQPIPDFVQDEAVTYTQGQIDLDKFVNLLKESIANNPILAMQMAGQLDQMEAGLNLFLNPLGTHYYSYSMGQLPFDVDSIGYLIAIECLDEGAFSNALGASLPLMGAASHDFLGNQIFTIDLSSAMPMPMPMPIPLNMSIAVGGGYAFLGTTNTVEEALRSIAHPSNRKKSRSTNAATPLLPHTDVSSWGYGDLRTSIEIQNAMAQAMTDDMFEEMEAFDPEMAAEMRKEFDENAKIQNALTDAITSLLGPMAWNMTADETGLNAHVIMLKPE